MAVAVPSNSFLTRFGFASGDGPPSALIFGSDLDAFNSVGVVLGQAHKTNARSRIFLCTTGDHEALAKKFPGELIAPLPFDSEPFVTLFLSLNRIRAVLVLENEADLPPALRTALHKRAAPISVANLLPSKILHLQKLCEHGLQNYWLNYI